MTTPSAGSPAPSLLKIPPLRNRKPPALPPPPSRNESPHFPYQTALDTPRSLDGAESFVPLRHHLRMHLRCIVREEELGFGPTPLPFEGTVPAQGDSVWDARAIVRDGRRHHDPLLPPIFDLWATELNRVSGYSWCADRYRVSGVIPIRIGTEKLFRKAVHPSTVSGEGERGGSVVHLAGEPGRVTVRGVVAALPCWAIAILEAVGPKASNFIVSRVERPTLDRATTIDRGAGVVRVSLQTNLRQSHALLLFGVCLFSCLRSVAFVGVAPLSAQDPNQERRQGKTRGRPDVRLEWHPR